MEFLKQLDSLHSKCMRENHVDSRNRDFRSYHKITFKSESVPDRFLIQKNRIKTKLLLVDGAQRVYLSDSQIIETILSLGYEDIQWFVNQLALLYQGVGHNFQFSIDGKTYLFPGMKHYAEKKEILLPSDTRVNIDDFCILVNFVYAKDLAWERTPISARSEKKGYDKTNFSKRTLSKYISLLDHYGLDTNRSDAFLNAIGYPLPKAYPGQVVDERSMFEHIELFDISLYV